MFEALILFGFLTTIGFIVILLPIYLMGCAVGVFFHGVVEGIRKSINCNKDVRLP